MSRIGIDIRKWSDFGIGSYLRGLVGTLLLRDTENDYYLFARPHELERIPRYGPRQHLLPEGSPLYSLRELWSLRQQARRLRLDLFHAPHYPLPPFLPCPAVVTVHDLIHLTMPASPWKRLYARVMMRRAVREAARVIVPSLAVRQELAQRFPFAENRIRVVPHGLAPAFAGFLASGEGISLPDVPDEYVLFVGNERPYKNLDGVLRAFAEVAGEYPGSLVVAGLPLPPSPSLLSRIEELGLRGRVHVTGYLDEKQLPALYGKARFLMAPSLAEGFGFPILEAMAAGLPVVTSWRGATAELAGDAALLVEPTRTEEIVASSRRLLGDPRLGRELARRGRERARRYDWPGAAEATLGIYREAMAPGEPPGESA